MTFDHAQAAILYRKLADLHDAAAPTPTPPVPPSPTPSRLPILTDTRIAALKSMQAANSPAYQRLKAIADNSKLTPNQNYDDPGLAAAIVWKVTGDASYAAAAWNRLLTYSAMPTSAIYDGISDAFIECAVVYGMLKGSDTTGQAMQLLSNLNALADFVLAKSPGSGGFQTSNANYTIPFYFGLSLTDAVSGSDLLSQLSAGLPIGGLDATAADRTTARNCIKQYVSQLSVGGTWPEGPYDTKSVPRLILGWAAMFDLTGVDHFPEVTAWIPQACDAALLDYNSEFSGFYPWGDRTRLELDYVRRLSIYVALQAAAVRIGDTKRAANVGYLIQSLLAKVDFNHVDTHFWFFYDDAALKGSRPADPIVNYSPGVGMLRRADGANLFAAFFPSTLNLNHEQMGQDLFLYANGENALGRPYGYSLQLADIDIAGQTQGNCYGTNGVAVCGLTKMDASGPIASESTPDYSYFVGNTHGLIYGSGQNFPSVEWLHELTRTVFYLPALSAIVVCDRVNLDDPRKLDLSKYNQPHRSAIQSAQHLVEQVWHCPEKPTVGGSGNFSSVQWNRPSGRAVSLKAFSTSIGLAVDVVDENVLWAGVSSIDADQKKWQFRIRPVLDRQWNCILTCICLDPANQPTVQAASQGSGYAGFSIGDTAVLFGIDQSTRLLDPATPGVAGARTTWLAGCSGDKQVVRVGY